MGMLVTLANRGHRHPSTLVRRSAIVVAMTGMVLRDALWWLVLIPLFAVLYAPATATVAFVKALIEIPRLTANQIRSDAETWPANWAGARRIWRARKGPDPVITSLAEREARATPQ